MRRGESGEGYVRLFITLLVLMVVVYVGVQAVPVYIANFKLEDYVRQHALRASVLRLSAEAVQNDIVNHASDLHLPVGRENVKVSSAGGFVKISVDYSVPVDLKVCTWVLHFSPSAEGRPL